MSTGKRRSESQLVRDRRRIADLYLQGWTQPDIADELKISQSTVSRDLKALQKRWLESTLVDFDQAKAQELAKVDRLEREYWAAWERSCEDAESSTLKTKGKVQKRQDEDSKFVAEQPAEVAKTSKGQAGDPRFLAGVQWCIERRCKILGLDAPERRDISGKMDLNVILDEVGRVLEMSEDEFTDFAGVLPDVETYGTLEKMAEVEG